MPPVAPPEDEALQGALEAFRRIRVQAEIGFDDEDQDQYTRLLADVLDAVRDFLELPGTSWSDVSHAMTRAVGQYREVTSGPSTLNQEVVGAASLVPARRAERAMWASCKRRPRPRGATRSGDNP